MERPHGSALAGATAQAVDPEFVDALVLLTTIAAADWFAIERGQQLAAGRSRVRPSGKPLRPMDLSSDRARKVDRTRTAGSQAGSALEREGNGMETEAKKIEGATALRPLRPLLIVPQSF